MPPFLHRHAEGTCLSVKVQPRASKNEIGEAVGNELKIRVTAPPVDSAANEALLELLVRRLGCARGAIRLLRGNTSRHKVVLIRGISADEVERKLIVKS